jgi:hypothetical protein
MASTCQWDCGCWDCATDRRNSIRASLIICAIIGAIGGLLVAYEVQSGFGQDDPDQDDRPRAQVLETA